MKKIFTLLVFLLQTALFSQSISVDTSTYTVPELVNTVLINSPCINATNVTWRTGTNFGSVNGIGYFQNSNPNFPMQSGVILSTGNVLNAGGPNSSILSDGTPNWTGDSDLQQALANAGVTMNSTNATVLEFDFTPISPNFDFDFLFASEEYGNFQCQFSDAFAFLLTNVATGVTTNLAIVPGTSDPISVVTIRNFLFNSSCASMNSQYFGSFNGGSNAAASATNFNGQTVIMNASAMLTPNVLYKIKLVIADRGDSQSDSAIFLSSNSFNIGQEVLGNDLTLANNAAICANTTTLLDSGLDPNTYSFVWRKDGITLPSETNATLLVSQPGIYELTYTNIAFPCQTITDSIVVEFLAGFTTADPRDLYRCDSGQSSYSYNLSDNTTLINAGTTTPYTISYHSSVADASSNSNALATTYFSNGNQTIYVRIVNPNTGCFIIKSFQLLLTNSAVAAAPTDYTECSTDTTSGTAIFDLSTLNNQVLNGLDTAIYGVFYYASVADVLSNSNPLPNFYNVATTTIYPAVRLLDDASCFDYTTANLIVSQIPLVDTLQEVITCTSYTLPVLTNGNYFTQSEGNGTTLFAGDVITETQTIFIYNINTTAPFCDNESSFNVTIIDPDEIPDYSGTYCDGFVIPSVLVGDYFTAAGGNGTLLPAGTLLTTSQTIHYYFESTVAPFCVIDLPSDLVISITQQVPTLPNGFDCSSFELQPLSYGNYYDAPGGTGNLLPFGSSITSSQTVYIYGVTGICSSQSSFQVVIGLDFPTDVTACANYQLPPLAVGNYYTGPMGTGNLLPVGTVINTTQTIYVYAQSQSLPNCTETYNFTVTIILPVIQVPTVTSGCENYTLPTLPVGNYYTGSGATGTMLNAGDVISNSQNLYIYVTDNNGCANEVIFFVTVFQRPTVDSRSDIDACHSYTLTSLLNGNYYTGPNGTGTMYSGGTVLTTSQQLYIYNTQNGCSAETSFQLTIFTITAQVEQDVTRCDNYVLPTLTGNNKYYTQPNGSYGTGSEIAAGTTITSTQTIYIFIESGERINCTDESSFVVTIIPTPFVDNVSNVTACNSYTLPNLTVGRYFTQSGGNGTELFPGGLITTNQTIYVYEETGTATNCFDEKSFAITIYNVDELQDITTCESYTLPVLVNGNYYNASGGTGGMLPQGSTINASQTVYIYGTAGFNPNCFDESSFDVTIIATPLANPIPIQLRTVCDEDGTNDGITTFNLSQLDSTVLGTQTGTEFSVTYFANLTNANANVNSITTTSLSLVYVRVSNSLTTNCYDIKPIQIIVNKLPEPTAQDGIICIESATGTVLNPYTFNSGLSASNHTFQWFDATGTIVGTDSNYQTNSAGTFSLIATNTMTGCSSEELFVTANPSEPAIVAYTVNEDFANNQVLTVQATGTGGNYEYQLDNGNFQSSPIFENVASGMHTITVRDLNECGSTTIDAIVINYPKFFTPNGDGANETWNIVDLREQDFSSISIFDRFGKLISVIKPSGNGWNGLYKNQMLPSDDYWFSVTYLKNGKSKEFKAHFALKR